MFYFVTKAGEKEWYINSMNTRTYKTERLVKTPEGSEDFTFLPDGRIIIGKDALLYVLEDDHWTTLTDFSDYFKGFYRIVVNREGTLLALVVFTGKKP
jgi:hypothetical protein